MCSMVTPAGKQGIAAQLYKTLSFLKRRGYAFPDTFSDRIGN